MSRVERNKLSVYDGEKWDVESVITSRVGSEEHGFYICNLSDVIKKYEMWLEKMPKIKPFYAVKCNDDVMVLKTLKNLGCGFDCATKVEIQKVMIEVNLWSKLRFINSNTIFRFWTWECPQIESFLQTPQKSGIT